MPEFSPYANVIFSRQRDFLGQMYPAELDIKYTTESNTGASYLVLLQLIGRYGPLPTSLYDKRDDFNFYITHVPVLSSNMPFSQAYGVFIPQLDNYDMQGPVHVINPSV